jgi:hypothetical protein
MKNLPILDLSIIALYLVAMVVVGVYFSRKNKSAEQFTKASGTIPGWAIGLSIYATFLSSNTFLGVPGKAFGSNWNAFVFSISMPFAAWVASKYFVPFYRKSGEISAYTHLEHRFGPWPMGPYLYGGLLPVDPAGKNGLHLLWYCIKPSSLDRLPNVYHYGGDGCLYHHIYRIRRYGGRHLDRSNTRRYKNLRRLVDPLFDNSRHARWCI